MTASPFPSIDDTQPLRPALSDTQPVVPPRRRTPRRRGCALIVVVALLLIGGLITGAVIERFRLAPVTLIIDGQAHSVTTRARTVSALLEEQGIALGDHDRLVPPSHADLPADGIVRIDRARAVTVLVNRQPVTVWTLATTPAGVLADAGITLTAADQLILDGQRVSAGQLSAWTLPARLIAVQQAQTVTLESVEGVQTLTTTAPTLGEALFDAGLTLYAADTVWVDGAPAALSSPVQAGSRIRVARAAPVRITVDGVTLAARTTGGTVAAALAEAEVALVGLDYSIPSETAAITPNMSIRVYRVKEALIAADEAIPYERVVEADPALELDQTQVVQAGQAGVRRTLVRVRYEDGAEVSRTTEAAFTAVPPQNEVVRYGTNVVLRTLETPDGPVQYWRTFRVYATSYHPAALGGDDVTATGRRLQHGIIATDPDLIPYGTEVYVENYGRGLIADTGGPRSSSRWIDLGYSDADWVNWHRWVTVYLLAPVPAEIDYFPPP